MTKIFISHSNQDNEFVRQLAQALKALGLNIWIDFIDIPAGMNWSTAIQQALDECEAMIVVITPNAMASPDVENEWQYYIDEEKSLIPVRWQPAKVHFQLRRIQYVDFHEKEFSAALDRLIAELQRQGFPVGEALPPVGVRHVVPSQLPRVEDILPPPFEWVEIPGGKVMLEDESDKDGTKGGAYEVPTFTISKYPITNAQFQVFVKSPTGYHNRQWWEFSEATQQWHKQNPQPRATAFPGDDHPRTNVSWFEAVAFCRWLTTLSIPEGSQVPPLLHIMLPTEQQWQRAAVGDTGWIYPWGNLFNSDKCNTVENGFRQTTPVTQYPQGASPYGVMDASGNIWEWCLNEWQMGGTDIEEAAQLRIVRGGGWGDTYMFARALNRARSNPDARSYGFGFRIVATSL